MSWNLAYLDAVGLPRWVARDPKQSTVKALDIPVSADATGEKNTLLDSADTIDVVARKTSLHIKALVNNPQAKFAILVDEQQSKAELQKAWKQLKFAWKQWQNQDFPASLFQINSESDYPLTELEQQQIIILDSSQQSNQSRKLTAPKLMQDKQAWWELLQQVQQQSQLL